MPSTTYAPEIVEAFACATKNDPIIETLELSHPTGGDPIYICRNNENLSLKIEDASAHVFRAVPFSLKRPNSGQSGLQEMQIQIDNVSRDVQEFVEAAMLTRDPISVKYRVYLASDPDAPKNSPPLTLTLVDVVITPLHVSGKARFADILNARFPKRPYTRARFPTLGG